MLATRQRYSARGPLPGTGRQGGPRVCMNDRHTRGRGRLFPTSVTRAPEATGHATARGPGGAEYQCPGGWGRSASPDSGPAPPAPASPGGATRPEPGTAPHTPRGPGAPRSPAPRRTGLTFQDRAPRGRGGRHEGWREPHRRPRRARPGSPRQHRACARRARRSPPAPRKSAPPGVSAAGGESGDPRGLGPGVSCAESDAPLASPRVRVLLREAFALSSRPLGGRTAREVRAEPLCAQRRLGRSRRRSWPTWERGAGGRRPLRPAGAAE